MSERVKTNQIPEGLRTYFQEYDPAKLDLDFFSSQADAVGAGQRAILIDRTPRTVMKRFLERQAPEVGRKRLEDL